MEYAEKRGMSFNEACEEVFIGAIACGLEAVKDAPKGTTFRFNAPWDGAQAQLFVRIQPEDKKILTNDNAGKILVK